MDAGTKKATLVYLLGTVLVRGFSIISTPLFSRLLTVDEYGTVMNFTSWAGFISCIMGLGLVYSVGNAWVDLKDEINIYIRCITIPILCNMLFFITLVMAFGESIRELFGLSTCLLLLLIVFSFFTDIESLFLLKLRFQIKSMHVLYCSIFNCIAGFTVSVCLIYSNFISADISRIIGLSFPCIITSIIMYLISKAEINITWALLKKYIKYGLKIGVPMVPHGLAMIMLAQIDRVMINSFCGSYDLGIYSMGYNFSAMIMVFISAINSALTPWQYEALSKNKFLEIKKVQNEISVFVSYIALFFISFAPEAILILGGEKYQESVKTVYPVLIGTLFQYFYQYYSTTEAFYKKNMLISLSSIGIGLLNFILNYIYIPQYGYISAAYTTLFCYFILYLIHMKLSKLITGRELFQRNYNILLMIMLMLISIAMYFIDISFICRLLLIMSCTLIYSWIERSRLISYIAIAKAKFKM